MILQHFDLGLVRFTAIAFFVAVMLMFVVPAAGQETDITDTAPPPLRKISEYERKALSAESDVKVRTKLALDLMSARLARSEGHLAKGEYPELYAELGAFHGLMDNTLAFLERSSRSGGKVLNNLKRFEIGLRTFSPRLEVIRRELPSRYEFYVRTLLKYVREARTRAVEPLFGDSVTKQPNTSEHP